MKNGTVAKILINMGSSVYCDTLIVVHSMSGTGNVRWYYGTTYDNWEFTGTMDAAITVDTDYGTTVAFKTAAGAQYWGIEVDGRQYIGTQIKIYEIFLGKHLELNMNPIYPVGEGKYSSVTTGQTPKGIRHSYHNFDRKSWNLNYEGITDTDKESIEGMLDYCHGAYKPLWFTLDPSTPTETYFVRLATDRFDFIEIISGAHTVNLSIEQEL